MAEQKTYSIKIDGINESINGVESLGDNVAKTGNAWKDTQKALKAVKAEMAGLDKSSDEWKQLAKVAGDYKDKLDDINQAARRFASDTKGIDDAINIGQSITSVYGLAEGAMSAFGVSTEDAVEAIQKMQSAMSILQSLKALQDTLRGSTATSEMFTKAMNLMSVALGKGSTASKVLRGAMLAIPLMLIITLVTELVLHWDEVVGWFTKTFPQLKNLTTWFNKVKGAIAGVSNAVWTTIKSFSNLGSVVKELLSGHWDKAVEIVKNSLNNITNAYQKGYADKLAEIEEGVTLKQVEENNKRTKHKLDMLKAQKGNAAKYSKEGIALQKKDFAERKKLAKGNQEELNKIAVEEASFYRECQESKSAAAKKAAQAQKEAAKEAAEAAKIAEEKKKDYADSYERLVQATTTSSKIALETQLKLQQAQAKELYDKGKWEEYKTMLDKIKKTELDLYTADGGSKLIAFWKTFTEQFKESNLEFSKFKDGAYEAIEVAKKAGKENRDLTEGEIDNIAKLYFNINSLDKTQRNNFKALLQNILNEWQLTAVKEIELEENKNKTIEEQDKKRYETAKNNAKKSFDNIKSLIKTTFGNGVENSPNLPSIYDRVFSKKKAKEAEDTYKNYWQSVLDQTKSELLKAEEQWDIYLFNVEKLYTKDSKEYRDAVDEKKKALKELIDLQNKAASGATGGTVSSDGKKNFNNQSPINKNESKTKYDDANGGFGLDPTNWSALWDEDGPIWENIGKLADLMFENVFDPIADGFSTLLEFQIEEAQAALDEATEMHDASVEKVQESQSKIEELNEKMKNSSGAQLEAYKQQQADEMLLMAQREAEEKRLQREKEKREKELERKQKQQKKLDLKMTLATSLANTAEGVTKALTWGFPLGTIFAAIIGAMGAIQIATITKQISKLADGGLLSGPSHSQGGIAVGNSGIEVEGGEYVVNKRSTKKYLPLLQQINEEGAMHKTRANQIGKFADGGQLNYQRIAQNLDNVNQAKLIQTAIGDIDFHPVVSVVDINRGQKNYAEVRQLSGARN